MRFVTFEQNGSCRPGISVGRDHMIDIPRSFALAKEAGLLDASHPIPETLVDLIAAGGEVMATCMMLSAIAGDPLLAPATIAAADVTLVAPIPRPLKNVFCVGSNYRAHVTEANKAQAKADTAPKLPVFFTKPPTAVVGPGASVRLDPKVSDRMDYEVELGVIIGTAGRNITQANAIDHIFGFTIINDVTARDLQRAHGGQYLKGKGLDTSCPMGPQIVTIDELPNFENLRIALSVNGDLRQDGNTGNMIFPIARLIESLSEGLTLEPGDILATGTPSGVGYAMDPPSYLKDGDKVTCEIEGIGQLTNVVRISDSAAFAA